MSDEAKLSSLEEQQAFAEQDPLVPPKRPESEVRMPFAPPSEEQMQLMVLGMIAQKEAITVNGFQLFQQNQLLRISFNEQLDARIPPVIRAAVAIPDQVALQLAKIILEYYDKKALLEAPVQSELKS